MLNTQKLLYILPDVAYVAELLPGKKEHTFVIHSFRQINGEFLDENDFLADNIQKLLSKLEADDYHLILPDFLFTNTIVEVNETSENKIKEHLKEKLLPSLSLTKETHDLSTTILTEYGGKTKIQLSAIEKSVLNPIAQHAPTHKVQITGISPLSWTVKSLVSLEPSISIIQMGSYAYLALHYIGVDQTISNQIANIETLGETIKTLKGAEPSIQTVYLLTNELVEEKLKEQLSDTLPLQQLTKPADEETQMPSYVKQVIEASMRTLSIEDFPVPQFALGKPVAVTAAAPDTSEPDEAAIGPETSEDTLPEPAKIAAPVALAAPVTPPLLEESISTAVSAEPVDAPPVTIAAETKKIELDDDEVIENPATSPEGETAMPEETPVVTPTISQPPVHTPPVSQPVGSQPTISQPIVSQPTVSQPTVATPPPVTSAAATGPIPPKNPTNSMVKMLIISATVFLATVGVGVGLGLAVITLTQKEPAPLATASPSPSAVSSPVPVPSPSPSPSPQPEIVKEDVKILIVNATTKAGYASEVATDLKAAGFTKVTAGNAKGEYEDGFHVLLAKEDSALITELKKATDLDLTFSLEKKTEDPSGQYDAVIVLAE